MLTITDTRGTINIRPSAKQYHISPQIHKDSHYKNQTANCYRIIAHIAMTEVLKHNQWLTSIRISNRNFDKDYTLQ